MKKFKKIIMIVTDSLGIGGDEENQKKFNDLGANTFYHVSESGLLNIPTWKKLGICSIAKIKNCGKNKNQLAYTARIFEHSNAKDTLAGHWEMMGIYTKYPFPVFTETGFPKELIEQLEKKFDGRKIIGNKSASGTDIINELANYEEENKLIVYTSADSVLQICANEETTGLDNLYRYAEEARKICSSNPNWNVGRVIARPYKKENNKWVRTFNRRDYANDPSGITVLDKLKQKGVNVISIGKINDIFNGRGISKSFHSDGDENGMDILINYLVEHQNEDNTFIFLNLVQFDSHFGHRRDVDGYAEQINKFDIKLSKLLNVLTEDDLLIITSDHGNDPTFPGYNHTRECVPATIYSKSFKHPKKLDDIQSMATLGNIVAKNFDVPLCDIGEDISDKLV